MPQASWGRNERNGGIAGRGGSLDSKVDGCEWKGAVTVNGDVFCLVCHSTHLVSKTMKSTKAPSMLLVGRLKIC